MKCPNCKIEMREIKSKSHYDAPVILDQCLQCGGLWFDALEMFTIKHGESKSLEDAIDVEMVNVGKLKEQKVLKSDDFMCPRDGFKLEPFKDLNFPKEIKVESCYECGGFWLNRGEFSQFQDHIKNKKVESKKELDDDLEKRIALILQSHSNKESIDALGNLGRFLSAPVRRNIFGDSSYVDVGGRKSFVLSAALEVVVIILRLFLR